MAKKKLEDTEILETELEETVQEAVAESADDDSSISDGKKHWYIVHPVSNLILVIST